MPVNCISLLTSCHAATMPCHLPVPISATLVPHFSAHQCHINATYQCPSELPFSVTHQC
ncbi:unnamed protein product [Staurois parvus]|uniref:Uncharacterized protein n=1 Tax=Staurois parvus TaxID=386267 RepID=A0ABN9D982_9NEOB|nr:unnamed protein product [Staurois parvus]